MDNAVMQVLRNAKAAKRTGLRCQKHGTMMMSRLSIRTGHEETYCPDCQAERLAELQADFDRRAQQEMEERKFKENSLVNSKMWDCTFSSFKAQDGSPEKTMLDAVVKAAKAYEQPGLPAHNTVLFGTPGAGKSHLAMAMMQQIHHDTCQTMAFVNISLLFSHIKDSFDNPAQYWTRDKAVKILTGVDLLCLDDLGTESSMGRQGQESSKWVQDVIYDILEGQNRVIITTNLSERQLQRVYDAKIFSRIFRNSDNTRFNFSGISDKRLSPIKEDDNEQQRQQNRRADH